MSVFDAVPTEFIPADARFGPGPSLIPQNRVEELASLAPKYLGHSHRSAVVKDRIKSLQEHFKDFFGVPEHEVWVGNGGATMLFDTLGLNLCRSKILHYVCGEFSSKWWQASKRVPWMAEHKEEVSYGEGSNFLSRSEHDAFDVVCATLNETSTGVQLAGLPEVGEDTLLMVDATSGACQVPCDVGQVDVFFFGPQKVLASEGGLWVALVSPRAVKRLEELKERPQKDSTYYVPMMMDLNLARDNSLKHQTFNTPSLCTIFFTERQIAYLAGLGAEKVYKAARERAHKVYAWAEGKPYLSPFVKEEKFRSVAVACVDIDEAHDAKSIVAELDKRGWVNGIGSYRKLGRNQFRLALFEAIPEENLDQLLKLLTTLLEGGAKA